jgi:hypothetical protein
MDWRSQEEKKKPWDGGRGMIHRFMAVKESKEEKGSVEVEAEAESEEKGVSGPCSPPSQCRQFRSVGVALLPE